MRLARDYEIKTNCMPKIDGEKVPWLIHADGPLVEPLDDQSHILWLPVLIYKPCPPMGPPNGRRLAETEEEA